jgi:hypothetical protein
VGLLAASAGIGGNEPRQPRDLVAGFDLARLPPEPAVLDV